MTATNPMPVAAVRVPATGRWLTANTTASPWPSGTTAARDCIRGRCSVSTSSPPSNSAPGRESRNTHCSGNTCSPYRSW